MLGKIRKFAILSADGSGLDKSSSMNDSTASGDSSLGNHQTAAAKAPPKKRRNLPGMPNPDSEVIAFSPTTLLATNRFICEICNKGFQRDQNLQLHRRGHNLPWKLRQRSATDIVKKRVYVCPEPSCVHHDPSRALGDLTGIKKHFCRKHGEKKWKCEKCSKKYAVQSDWKAHSKICGTKEYKCECGTLFSRRDSFITHRAFCNVLAEETTKTQTAAVVSSSSPLKSPPESSPPLQPPPESSPPPPPPRRRSPSPEAPLTILPDKNHEFLQSTNLDSNSNCNSNRKSNSISNSNSSPTTMQIIEETSTLTNLSSSCTSSSSNGSSSSNVFSSLFAPSTSSASFPNLFQSTLLPHAGHTEPVTLSATALLQKAAEMGPSSSNASLLRGIGVISSSSSSSSPPHHHQQQIESDGIGLGLGLGLCDNGSGLKELMLGTPSVFGPKHATLDFLGLGLAASGGSALMSSINGGLDVTGQDLRRSS